MLKKILKGMAFTVAILLALLFAFVAEENIRGKVAWENHLKDLAAKGDSLDIKSIMPPPVPDDQNMAAAPIFAELMSTNQPDKIRLKKLLPDHWPSDLWDSWRAGRRFDLAKLQTALTNETLAAMLNRWQPILQEAEVAMQRPQTRFPVRYEDGYAALMPHLNPLMKLARAYCIRAEIDLAAGQTAAALHDVRMILRIANGLKTEPMFIPLVVRAVILQLAVQPVWDGLAEQRWSDAQLQTLQAEFVHMDLLLDLRRSYQLERCLVPWVMNMMFNDRKGFSAVLKSGSPARPDRIVLFSGLIYINCLNVELCYLERILPTLDAAAGRIYPERALSAGKWLDLRPSWYAIPYHILDRLLIPAEDSLLLKVGFVQTAMQNTTIACALERYRRANGRLPEKLAALVPQFFAAIPHDVVDGQPLRYRLDGTDGFLLYSIGWNRKDDGGQIAWTKPSSKNEKPQLNERQGDWVWRSKPAAN